MILFRRHLGQGLVIEGPCRITLHLAGHRVTLGVDADESVGVFRDELKPAGRSLGGPEEKRILAVGDEEFLVAHPSHVALVQLTGDGKVELSVQRWLPLPRP